MMASTRRWVVLAAAMALTGSMLAPIAAQATDEAPRPSLSFQRMCPQDPETRQAVFHIINRSDRPVEFVLERHNAGEVWRDVVDGDTTEVVELEWIQGTYILRYLDDDGSLVNGPTVGGLSELEPTDSVCSASVRVRKDWSVNVGDGSVEAEEIEGEADAPRFTLRLAGEVREVLADADDAEMFIGLQKYADYVLAWNEESQDEVRVRDYICTLNNELSTTEGEHSFTTPSDDTILLSANNVYDCVLEDDPDEQPDEGTEDPDDPVGNEEDGDEETPEGNDEETPEGNDDDTPDVTEDEDATEDDDPVTEDDDATESDDVTENDDATEDDDDLTDVAGEVVEADDEATEDDDATGGTDRDDPGQTGVGGETITDASQLPRTGASTTTLTSLGLLVVALGLVLVRIGTTTRTRRSMTAQGQLWMP